MREIKFRGLDIDGHWWYGELKPEGEYHLNLATFFANLHVGVITPETVGEYTGLKDKNGVEIYEGDIVQAYRETYGKGLAKDGKPDIVQYIPPGFYPFNEPCHGSELAIEDTEYEILGNIYENPELVEAK